ncbi:MAG: nucleoside diphosphate kinase regulator [Bdellovibrionales bacterium]|nr:nucleoside diphosphate kinase regulator [Bdellovibrionales bacterium]
MKPVSALILSQNDSKRILSLIDALKSESLDLLEEEIGRATIVPDEKLPPNVVAMDSTVRFVDADTGQESVFTLVYPHEASVEEGRISILAPVGTALIGLRTGQSIRWPVPGGKSRNLTVVSVSPRSVLRTA